LASLIKIITYNAAKIDASKISEQKNNDESDMYKFKFWSMFSHIFDEKLDLKKIINDDPVMESVILEMKERYGKKLSIKRNQIKLLGGLIRHLKKKHGNDWKERIKIIVESEFSEYSVELLDKLDKLDNYNEYLKNNRSRLNALDRNDKREMMLEKKREIFGSECDEIWGNEIAREQISDMLDKLDRQIFSSLNEKMNVYTKQTRSLYSDEADKAAGKSEDQVMVRNYEVMSDFLNLKSVQLDLDKMDPNERTLLLRDFRKSIGLKDDMIKEMEKVDAQQDAAWENGKKYNNEKSRIISDYTGEEREKKLDEARKKYLGQNADVIKYQEETFKMNRYQFPRRWGLD
jgi:hypothetical protein